MRVGRRVRVAIVTASGEFFEITGTVVERDGEVYIVQSESGGRYRTWPNAEKYGVASSAQLVGGHAPGDPALSTASATATGAATA